MNLDNVSVHNNAPTGSLREADEFDAQSQNLTLRESVEIAMKNYFSQLENEKPTGIYGLVLAEVEAPLMEAVMSYTKGNQTKASEVLGLNRGTLRKKLKAHGLN